jgi:hypothetical protein
MPAARPAQDRIPGREFHSRARDMTPTRRAMVSIDLQNYVLM